MKRFFLKGDYMLNAGPQNVNRTLVENADESMDYVKSKSYFPRLIEKLWKMLRYQTIVFSGGASRSELLIAKLLRKRVIFIMHGCARYENIINKLNLLPKELQLEYDTLKYAAKIVAVSENYSNWARREYPEFVDKVTFVNNGLDINKTFYKHLIHNDSKYSIAISGGNRPIKCNMEVCKAVAKLIGEGMNITIKAFGVFYENGEPILKYPFVTKMGQMDKNAYYAELRKTDLYVIASDIEPFGLVVGDAINCGCALLMSKNIGALNIFDKLTSDDLLDDNHDTIEMAHKIKQLLISSNAKRLYESVNKEKCSGKQAFSKLKGICVSK